MEVGTMTAAAEIEQAFRKAMRRFAATVSVISARQGVERHAMTATAVTSLSMAPPSLLVCVYGGSRFHRVLAAQELFCVNVLYRDQAALSQEFSRPMTPKEEMRIGWADDGAYSYIADAQAVVQCRKVKQIPFGTHTIFIGAVTNVVVRDDVAPLIFQDGQYGQCVPLPTAS
jgi:flavin reductase (DIM6/NTAB) family NADH-FMN oxidoreductase RutF